METPETTTGVINSPLTDFQKSALDVAEKNLETLRHEMDTKKYLIDLNEKDIIMVDTFIKYDAPWTFTESLGILEIEKDTEKAIKTKKLFVGAIAVEAIYYYMSKIKGKGKTVDSVGFTNVTDYLRVLKAIQQGVERVKKDADIIRDAEFIVAARREGIEPDSSLAIHPETDKIKTEENAVKA